MVNRTTLLVVLVAVAASAAGFVLGGRFHQGSLLTAVSGTIAIGERYRDVVLPDLGGTPRRLSEWDGRPRLLNFWATWCEPCRVELPMLERLHRENTGIVVLGVALDDPDAVRRFAAQHAISYPQLLDTPRADDTSVLYGDTRGVLPYSVLIDADGVLVARKHGAFREGELRDWAARVQRR
jgi:thiol-disulfide isomerase/thioredoxin